MTGAARPTRKTGLAALLALLALRTSAAATATVISIEYPDQPPYAYTEGGVPSGVIVSRVREVFMKAKVDATFSEVPIKRILRDVQTGERPTCSPTWYRLPERELFAKFSLPLYEDKPQLVLAAPATAAAVRAHSTLKSLLSDPALQLAVVDGASYGTVLDGWIAAAPRPPLRVSVHSQQLARMLGVGRADYMIIDADVLEHLDRDRSLSERSLQRTSFADIPPGQRRHLMCSKSVDDATLERLNAAIRQFGWVR